MVINFFKTSVLLPALVCSQMFVSLGVVMFLTESAMAQGAAFGSSGDEIQTGSPRFFDPGAVMEIEDGGRANVDGRNVNVNIADRKFTGYFMPDGRGGVIFTPGKEVKGPSQRYIEAREIKLKVRELADQLTANLPESLKGAVFLPVSFVSQDNFDSTSSFGRYIAEQLYLEFNQRGMNVREYRLAKKITMHEGVGETALTRRLPPKSITSKNSIVAVGTYYSTRDAVMVNARLVRGCDGVVLGSANLVFKQTLLSRSMLANRSVKPGNIRIRALPRPRPAAGAAAPAGNPFDLGQDIH